MTSLDDLPRIGVLKRGDVLVLRAKHPLSREAVEKMQRFGDDLKQEWGIGVIVLDPSLEVVEFRRES